MHPETGFLEKTQKPGFSNNTFVSIEILETRFLKETGFLAGEEGPKTCRYFRFAEGIVKKTGFLNRSVATSYWPFTLKSGLVVAVVQKNVNNCCELKKVVLTYIK